MKKLTFRCGRTGCRKVVKLLRHPEQYAETRKCKCGGTLHDYSYDRKRNKDRININIFDLKMSFNSFFAIIK